MGAIVPEKSHWYQVDFSWKNGTAHYNPIANSPATIFVIDGNGNYKILKRLNFDQAERTLEVKLAPDGNMNDQFLAMKDKATEWSEKLRTGILPRRIVSLAFSTTITRSLEYFLLTTTLSEKQCAENFKPLLK
jgi:hypothetical protein